MNAIDTETTGLKHAYGHKAFLVAYTDENDSAHTVLAGCDIDNIPRTGWVGHNIGFDLPFLKDWGLEPRGTYHDVMIAAHVYNNLEEDLDLASLATKYCGIPNTEDVKLEEWFQANGHTKNNRRYNEVPADIILPYAKADVIRTKALAKFYESKGVFDSPAYKAEMRVLPVVSAIASRGMCVDTLFAKQEFLRATQILADLELKALQEYKVENLGSVQQVADALFTRGGLKCITFTDKKNICLDEEALQKYDHPLVSIVLEHREVSKLAGTYLQAILEKARHGRLFSTLKQVGARTGRFSSSDPNLQNIPRTGEHSPINLRKAFICSPGCKLLLVDLSQIELRLLAHYAKEKLMIDTLTDRKGDIHTTTCKAMFGEVNDELRTVAKTLNFAVVYGAGVDALVSQINKALPNKKITANQAREFKEKFFRGYPAVQQFLWDVQSRIRATGFVFGKSGREYKCPSEFAYRAANYLIQGEAAMLMKEMMCDVEELLAPTKSKLVNVIHDEFIFDLAEEDVSLIPKIVSTIERPEGWRVPIYANASISSTNWAEKRKVT